MNADDLGAALKAANGNDTLVQYRQAPDGGWLVSVDWTGIAAAALRLADVERLRAIAARAQAVIADGGPDETPTARYILTGRN